MSDDYIYQIGLKAETMRMAHSYSRTVPQRISIPNDINMDMLKKAVWLNNNIFQSEKKPYVEQLLTNCEGEVIYYYPTSSETILTMDARFAKACMIVYTAVTMGKNITAKDMEELNNIYKELKAEYGT